MKHDITFDRTAQFGSTRWAATTLGRSADWLRSHRDTLARAGFPAPDPVTGQYLKADVNAWIEKRRRVGGSAIVDMSESPDANPKGPNYENL